MEREIAPLPPVLEKFHGTLEGLQSQSSTELTLSSPLQPKSHGAQNVHFHGQRQKECSKLCLCQCHEQKSFVSPRWTESLFGQLFLTYSGRPLSQNHNCNIISCQEWKSNQVVFRATYFFPSWLLQRVIVVIDRWSPIGHVMSVRTPRIVPDSPGFYPASIGKLHTLQKLFRNGEASPFDTRGSDGYTFLQVSSQG